MNIFDLEFCHPIEYENKIIGGISAVTYADASTYSGAGDAVALAVANGDNSYTNTITDVVVWEKHNVIISKAKAVAIAIAWDEDEICRSKSRDVSVTVVRK